MRALAAAALGVALSGCATGVTRAVLLADENGHVGALAVLDVRTEAVETVLSMAGARASITGGALRVGAENPRGFAVLLAGLPRPPISGVLYFTEGATTLTAESEATLAALLDAWRRAGPGAQVDVIAYTDTTGSAVDNDALSFQRAIEVSKVLEARGFAADPDQVRAIGRGERDLLVPTPDETPEPRNRRVEVIIR